jgi:single-stranded-DNA-specific exonuclease
LIEESISPEEFVPTLFIDAPLSFADIDDDFVRTIEDCKPYGEGNPKPLFVSRHLVKKRQPQKVRSGWSVWLTDGIKTFEALVFDKDCLATIREAVSLDIVYSLGFNTYHNSPRLTIKDCRAA